MDISNKLATIAENEQRVYDAGVKAGKQAAYDEFWDEYQDNGARTDYRCAFAGIGWTENTCKPKYDMQPTNAERMFATQCFTSCDLDEIGVTLDFSQCTNMAYTFYQFGNNAEVPSTLGIIDLSASADVTSVFNGVGIRTIRGLVPPKIAMGSVCFQIGLVNLTVIGEFTASVNLSRCSRLTDESVQSVIDHLADLTGQTTQTVTFHATVGAKLTETQKESIANRNWTLVY